MSLNSLVLRDYIPILVVWLLICGPALGLDILTQVRGTSNVVFSMTTFRVRALIWWYALTACLISTSIVYRATPFFDARTPEWEVVLSSSILVLVALNWPYFVYFFWAMTESFKEPSTLLIHVVAPIVLSVLLALTIARFFRIPTRWHRRR